MAVLENIPPDLDADTFSRLAGPMTLMLVEMTRDELTGNNPDTDRMMELLATATQTDSSIVRQVYDMMVISPEDKAALKIQYELKLPQKVLAAIEKCRPGELEAKGTDVSEDFDPTSVGIAVADYQKCQAMLLEVYAKSDLITQKLVENFLRGLLHFSRGENTSR